MQVDAAADEADDDLYGVGETGNGFGVQSAWDGPGMTPSDPSLGAMRSPAGSMDAGSDGADRGSPVELDDDEPLNILADQAAAHLEALEQAEGSSGDSLPQPRPQPSKPVPAVHAHDDSLLSSNDAAAAYERQ